MSYLDKTVKELKLPELLSRDEMKKILINNEYGEVPNQEYTVTYGEPQPLEPRMNCGIANVETVDFTVTTKRGSHTVKVTRLLQRDGKKHPTFCCMNFQNQFYFPAEMIADRGFNVIMAKYDEVTTDNADFSNGLSGILLDKCEEKDRICGKIAVWAWFLSRLVDHALTLPEVDAENIASIGHSRLGKTSLVAGMMDERIKYVISNDSGCSGAALTRGSMGVKKIKGKYSYGEAIWNITGSFPYWFVPRYMDFCETGITEGFDQHYLIATIAPRYAYVASASMDDWANLDSEYLSCVAASKVWEEKGMTGFVSDDRLPKELDTFHDGNIGYHMRRGMHFLSYYDWNKYMDFIDLKIKG